MPQSTVTWASCPAITLVDAHTLSFVLHSRPKHVPHPSHHQRLLLSVPPQARAVSVFNQSLFCSGRRRPRGWCFRCGRQPSTRPSCSALSGMPHWRGPRCATMHVPCKLSWHIGCVLPCFLCTWCAIMTEHRRHAISHFRSHSDRHSLTLGLLTNLLQLASITLYSHPSLHFSHCTDSLIICTPHSHLSLFTLPSHNHSLSDHPRAAPPRHQAPPHHSRALHLPLAGD